MSENDAVKIEDRSGCLWITLPDSITMYNNKDIEHIIGKELHDKKEMVVLDFTNTQTVYSAGLGLMIRIRRFVTERGGSISLVNVPEPVQSMFVSLNINKVFPIYATDVEYEISQKDFVDKSIKSNVELLLITRIEHDSFKIHLSGDMIAASDYAACRKFEPSPVISLYLIDLSGIRMIDATGIEEFIAFVKKVASAGGTCRVYGISDVNKDMLSAMGAEKYLTFHADEKNALSGT